MAGAVNVIVNARILQTSLTGVKRLPRSYLCALVSTYRQWDPKARQVAYVDMPGNSLFLFGKTKGLFSSLNVPE